MPQRRFPPVGVFAIALSLAAAHSAGAQDHPVRLDTLYTVGTRLPPGLAGQARAVEVLTHEQLAVLPAGTVVQALDWAFGTDLLSRSEAQADLSIRGASYEQVLVLMNGVPMSDLQTGHHDLDLTVPLDRVERIEILRGPASAAYGSDAMGGVINIVTRRPATGAGARLETGSFGTLAGALDGGIAVGATRIAGGAGYRRSDGHRPGTDYELAEVHLESASPVLEGELAVRMGQAWKDFGAADFYAPFPSYEETRTTTAAASWSGPLSDRLRIEPRLTWRRHTDRFVLVRDDPAFYTNDHATSTVGVEAVLRYDGGRRLHVAGGAQLGRDLIQSSSLGDRTQDRWAAFAEATTTAGPVMVNAGIRGDHYETFGLFAVPSLGATVQWHPMRLRASVARSFRAPTWTERYYEDPVNRGRPDLGPERAWALELGADVELTPSLWLTMTAHQRRAQDLIDWARPDGDSAAQWETRNVESATFRGVELELSAEDVLGTQLGLAAGLLSVSAAEAAGYVSKYALRPLTRDVALTMGRRMGRVGSNARLRYRQRESEEGYWLLDWRVAVTIPPGELFADVLNGLDAEYADITGAPAAGRSVRVGVRVGR